MTSVICSIYDSKAEAYSQPMYFQSVGQAVRSFSDEANRADSNIGKHPEDYTMFHFGNFDERSGDFKMLEAPVALQKAINVVIEKVLA